MRQYPHMRACLGSPRLSLLMTEAPASKDILIYGKIKKTISSSSPSRFLGEYYMKSTLFSATPAVSAASAL